MWIEIIDLAVGTTSITINLLLLYMIIMKTSSELKIYSRILIQGCLVDLVFTIIVLITQAVCLLMNNLCLLAFNTFSE